MRGLKQQHSKLCKQLQSAEITLYTILRGGGWFNYVANSVYKLSKPINSENKGVTRSNKLARKMHASSVQSVHKVNSTTHAMKTQLIELPRSRVLLGTRHARVTSLSSLGDAL